MTDLKSKELEPLSALLDIDMVTKIKTEKILARSMLIAFKGNPWGLSLILKLCTWSFEI